MYAYVDESGNTGVAIFDPNQPLFITAAMLTRTNFDVLYRAEVGRIAGLVGASSLHAVEMGTAKVEAVSSDLLKLVKKADARFFLSRVEKRYLATCKVYDTYFDTGENKAVPWHVYNIRQLRLILMFKIASFILDEELARLVWDCLISPKERRSKELFLEAAQLILERSDRVPDDRSKAIISDAMRWAIANPDEFSVHTKDKLNRLGHSPNFVAFTNLIAGVDDVSKTWKRPLVELVHDEQTEFEKSFRFYHELISNASDKEFAWPGEKPTSIRKIPGSVLRTSTEEQSPGLHVIDIVLWLFKRVITGHEIGYESSKLLDRVFLRGQQSDFSFDGVSASVTSLQNEIDSTPMSDEDLQRGHDFVALNEERRRKAMEETS